MRKAVLVVDMLNDFITGSLKIERAQRIIPNLKRLLEEARKRNVSILYVNDAHYESDFEISIWGKHAMKGTAGAQVIPELKPTEKDYIIEKRAYSGFFETGLDSLLRSLGVDTLILCGVATDICVEYTAAGAFFRGYKITLAEDGTETLTEEAHRAALERMAKIYGAEVKKIDEIVREL